MSQTVLLAGATGMLGSRIAHHLLAAGGADLRLLVRPAEGNSSRRQALQPLLAAGATVVEGDVADPRGLAAATRGVEVVVSALQGGHDVVVDGQVALAEAAAEAGVRRFLPSDFAMDIFKATPGELASFDVRREAAERIAQTGLPTVHVLNGAFLDGFVEGGGVLDLDDDAGTASFWGTGDERIDATSVDDTAQYTALAALDRDLPPGKFAVVGDRPSAASMLQTLEQVAGRSYTQVSRGTLAELRESAAQGRSHDPWSMEAMVGGYLVYMLGGQTALEDLQNDRYPQVRPRTFADLVAAAQAGT